MTDVTDLMLTYRECVRHIWNTYFRAEAEPQQDWDLRDQFYDAALILFQALVLRGLDVGDAKLLPNYFGDQAAMMFLRLEVDTCGVTAICASFSSLIGGISVSETFSFTKCASSGQCAIHIL